MPATYQRTVQWTGENTGGANYNWIDVNGAETQGWITRQESSTTDVWNFTISDNNTGATRTANYEVRHWTWVQGTTDTTLSDSFRITQYADSGIEVTTTAAPTTAAPTTTEAPTTAAPTTTEAPTTTTEAPTTTTEAPTTTTETPTTTTEAPSIYTLTYVGNGATGGSTSPTSGTLPLTVAVNGFTRTNHSFVEWNTNSSGNGSGYGEGDNWNVGNGTLYAIWQQNTTTQPPVNPAINFQSTSKTLSADAGSFVDIITRDSGAGAGEAFTYTYDSGSSGAGAGTIYWATDTTGATQTFAPIWITGVSGGFGSGFGSGSNTQGSVTVTYSGNTKSLGARNANLVITHPQDGDIKDVLPITQNAPITTTAPTTAAPTFYWLTAGGGDGQGSNPGQLFPAHYNGSNGVSGDLSAIVGSDYVAGAEFYLWGEYKQNGVDITTTPSGGWGAYITTPTYIDFTQASYSSAAGMWEFTFMTDSSDSGFPSSTSNDKVAAIINNVAGNQAQYNVIIDNALSCHVAGTVMHLADGSTKLVENLQVGDILTSYDISGLGHDETTSTWEEYSSQLNQFSASTQSAEVVGIRSSTFGKYVNFNNGLTKVTEEHPVLIKDSDDNISFKQVVDVVIGDSFYINDAWVEVTSREVVEETITAYTIDVEERDVYVADGILWHNNITVEKFR